MAVLPRFLVDPGIGRHLLREEGEVIVDEVRKHWVVYVVPVLLGLLGLCVLGLVPIASVTIAWLPLTVGLVLLAWAAWRAMAANMDRFVITNMRVFRVKGVLARSLATMPLGRILDITVVQPMVGRVLGYGHFTFESAAEAQGLRDIRFVGRPGERDLAIQRVVQRAGLRGAPRFSG
jgi:uncharacterized membrane protein YdbT with pleckstrin-like domain